MIEIETATISSKGQIVIPAKMRKGLKEGDRFLIIRDQSSFLLKRADDLDEKFKDDFKFARRTEEAWNAYDRGEFKTVEFDDFIKEFRKW
jgi:AbrB family looped-hinge helix DNA binding protein